MPTTIEEVASDLQQTKKLWADGQQMMLGAVDTLTKQLEKTNPGVNVQKMMLGHTGGGAIPGLYMPDGSFHPVSKRRRKGTGFGKCTNPDNGFEATLGEYFNDFYKWSLSVHKGQADLNALSRLKQYGVGIQQIDNNYFKKALLNEGQGVAGGYTVPPMFLDILQRIQGEDAIIEPGAEVLPLDSLTLTIPSLDMTTNNAPGQSNILGGIKASWSPEGTINESEPQFRSTELTAHFLGLYAIASIQLLRDNAVGLEGLLTELFRLAAVWAKDYAFLQGNGVGQPLGIVNCPATIAVTRTVPGAIKWADVNNMFSKMWAGMMSDPCVWIGHQSIVPQIAGMVDNAGNPVFIPRDAGVTKALDTKNNTFGKLYGKDLYLTEKLPALGTQGDLLLVNRALYVVGERQEYEMELNPSVRFLNYQMVWRVALRLDGQPWLNNPITLADGTYQVSPFVALK